MKNKKKLIFVTFANGVNKYCNACPTRIWSTNHLLTNPYLPMTSTEFNCCIIHVHNVHTRLRANFYINWSQCNRKICSNPWKNGDSYMYHLFKNLRKNTCFCHTVPLRRVLFLEWSAVTSLYTIKKCMFVIKTVNVYSQAGIQY
jgi:hypothetical protein